MRIISFSADGIKNAADKGFFDWLKEQEADFVCVQDLQCSEYDLQDSVFFPEEYNAYFLDDVDGKANGVAIYCRQLPKAIMTGLGFADFEPGQVVNLASGRLTSVRDFVGEAARQIGLDTEQLGFGDLPTRPEEMKHEAVNITRQRELLGETSWSDVGDGVRRALAREAEGTS